MNPSELNQLVDEWATAAAGEERDPQDLQLIVQAIRKNSHFAQRTAEVFLSMQALRLPNLEPSSTPPQFTALEPRAWSRSWKPAAAALLLGLVLGRISNSAGVGPPLTDPEQDAIALQLAPEAQLEPARAARSIRIQPYHYADGLFSGKSIEVVTRNN